MIKELAEEYAYENIGILMTEYVKWVIDECQKSNINKIYFLARDGYVLKLVAEEICKSNNLKIECKYLYCSRYSLRMPTYFFLDDEKYDLIFYWSNFMTYKTLLDRVGMDDKEQQYLYSRLGINDPNKQLSNQELIYIRDNLKCNTYFNEKLNEHSKNAYKNIIKYFRQEGLFENEKVIIVDSGWSGSMQRSLRQLLEREEYIGTIIGFYFGMYEKPKSLSDGEYKTFYFDKSHNMKHKIMFSNILFECMLSAPHGMTVGYECDSNNFVKPKLKKYVSKDMKTIVDSQIIGIKHYLDNNREHLKLSNYKKNKSIKKVYHIIKSCMVYPNEKHVAYTNRLLFCDDMNESYHISLSDKKMINILDNYLISKRIKRKIRKVLGSNGNAFIQHLYCPYFVIRLLPTRKQWWYRLNIFIVEYMKYSKKKMNEYFIL